MLEKLWQCFAWGLMEAVGHWSADTTLTTSPSKTFFSVFTWTATNPDCSLWEWTVDWSVHGLVWWVLRAFFFFWSSGFLLRQMFFTFSCVLIKGGVRFGKQCCEWTSHSELRACGAKRGANVHDLVSFIHRRAVSPRCLRSVQDEALQQHNQDVQVCEIA